MALEFEGFGMTTPETRAVIMGEMVKYVASLSQPAAFSGLYMHLLKVFDVREEEIGGDIHHAYSILVLSGAFLSNDYDEQKKTVTVSARTTVRPNKFITDYIWREAGGQPSEPDDE